jgi:hypothetical protein
VLVRVVLFEGLRVFRVPEQGRELHHGHHRSLAFLARLQVISCSLTIHKLVGIDGDNLVLLSLWKLNSGGGVQRDNVSRCVFKTPVLSDLSVSERVDVCPLLLERAARRLYEIALVT